MPNLADQIRARVDAFVADITGLVHGAAIENVREAFGASGLVLGPPSPGARPSRPRSGRKTTAKRAKATKTKARAKTKPNANAKKPSPSAKAAKASKRPRRSPEDLARMQARLLAHVKAKPGQGIEQIGKELRIATKDLAGPVKKLIEAKSVATKGQKRATTYWVG